MPYPNSFDVFDGMPTAYQHYNNLRSDALRFGQSEANAANVGAMMDRYESGMNLELLDTKRLRVVASATRPVCIMIGGYPLQITSSVDLSSGLAPVGGAATYYVFAVRSAGQTGFSLDVNTTATEISTRRIIGICYYDGTKIVKDSIRTLAREEDNTRALQGAPLQVADGRLTLVPGSPHADAGASTAVYYTPAIGNRISLYVAGLGWRVYSFTEVALQLSGLSAGNYDIFAANEGSEGSALVLSAVKWSTNSARTTAIVRQNGVWVLSGQPHRRYLGTVRLYATGTTIDDPTQRFLWNAYNRQPRRLFKLANAASWTYSGAGVWRAANADETLRVEVVVGLDDTCASIDLNASVNVTDSRTAMFGICRNGVTDPLAGGDTLVTIPYAHTTTTLHNRYGMTATHKQPLEIGYHFYQWVEMSNGGVITFYGAGGAFGTAALTGLIEG
jgi:hypothetical protein